MTPVFRFAFLAAILFSFLLLRGNSWGVDEVESPDSVLPVPLDELVEELRAHLEFAAANSWKMELQDILMAQGEAHSTRLSSGKSTKVRLNAGFGLDDESSGLNQADGLEYRYDFLISKPLYHWGALEADHEFGILQVQRTHSNRQVAFLGLYESLVNQYIDYLILLQRKKHSAATLAFQKEQLELFRDQEQRGELPREQLINEDLNLNQAALDHQSLENSISRAERYFRSEAGLDSHVPLSIRGKLPAVAGDLTLLEDRMAGFIAQVEKLSVRFQERQLRLDQETKKLHKFEVDNRPKFNGVFRVRRDVETVGGILRRSEIEEVFAGLEFSWSIFDGGAMRALALDSIQTKRQLERELAILKDAIISETNFLLEDLKIHRESSLLIERHFARALEQYEQMDRDVEAGRMSERDLRRLRQNLEHWRTNLYISRGIYYKTLTNIYVSLEYPSILAYIDQP
ncbi:MAG: TolC family protein [Opitutae bacterium]|nr:TolC family protein [Opitutae bacterium]